MKLSSSSSSSSSCSSRAAELRRFVSDTLAAASRDILAAVERLLAELEAELQAASGGLRRRPDLRSAAGVKCKSSSSPAEENQENQDLASPSRSLPLRCRYGTKKAGTKKNLIQLRIRILDDPQTTVLSNSVLKRCPVQELRCRPGLQEADFAVLLRTSFPRLAAGDRPFDLLTSDRRRRLLPLRLKRLTPEEIQRSSGSSSWRRCTVHIRPKEAPEEPADVHIQPTEETCLQTSEPVPASGISSGTQMEQRDGDPLENPEPAATSEMEGEEPSGNWDPERSEDQLKGRLVRDKLGLDGPTGPDESAGSSGPDEPTCTAGPDQMKQDHDVSEVSCKICRSAWDSAVELVQHVWRHHAGDSESTCGVCGEASESAEVLKDHLQNRHPPCGESVLEVHGEHAAPTGREDPQEAERHRCYICHQEFQLREQLKVHRRTHRNRKSHLCGVCGKSLSDYRSLSRHMMIHSEERPHGCRLCGKRFKLAGTLRQHEKIHTERQRSFLCDVCCKMFLTGQQLHDHMTTHGEEKLHRCARCGKAFAKKGALTTHMRVHTGETPYRCPHCGWSFRWKSNLVEHLRVHSGIKPFVCGICGKACARKTYLTVHMRTHNGERPYRCSVCQKVFTQGHCLKTHMRSHQGAPSPP